MDFIASFDISASRLSAQRKKMDVIVSNLANASTIQTPEGGPYKRKVVVLAAEPVNSKFGNALSDALSQVKVQEIFEDGEGLKKVHDPTHPNADDQGFVTYPNVNVMTEMADMITVNRAYEACVTALDVTKNMTLKALDIGK
jgi:flagellar basal-body rod protein FlgC